jgi:hypothetical protein
MTTITINQNIKLPKNDFIDLEEVLRVLYEEYLEQKLQYAKTKNKFIDY